MRQQLWWRSANKRSGQDQAAGMHWHGHCAPPRALSNIFDSVELLPDLSLPQVQGCRNHLVCSQSSCNGSALLSITLPYRTETMCGCRWTSGSKRLPNCPLRATARRQRPSTARAAAATPSVATLQLARRPTARHTAMTQFRSSQRCRPQHGLRALSRQTPPPAR